MVEKQEILVYIFQQVFDTKHEQNKNKIHHYASIPCLFTSFQRKGEKRESPFSRAKLHRTRFFREIDLSIRIVRQERKDLPLRRKEGRKERRKVYQVAKKYVR